MYVIYGRLISLVTYYFTNNPIFLYLFDMLKGATRSVSFDNVKHFSSGKSGRAKNSGL